MKRAGKKAEDDAAVQIAAKQDAFDQLNTLYAEQVCTYICMCVTSKNSHGAVSDCSKEEYHSHRIIILLIIMIMITLNKINQTKYNRDISVSIK